MIYNDQQYQVVVYSGQMDLIVDTMGTNAWVQKLKWSGVSQWNAARRVPLYNTGKKARVLWEGTAKLRCAVGRNGMTTWPLNYLRAPLIHLLTPH